MATIFTTHGNICVQHYFGTTASKNIHFYHRFFYENICGKDIGIIEIGIFESHGFSIHLDGFMHLVARQQVTWLEE